MASESTTVVSLRGIDVPLVRRGSGPPVLALHGGEGPVADLPFNESIASGFELLHPTHPGFDGTAIPEHFDNLQDLVFLYLDLIDSLDLHDAILMGFSMGGWLATEIAVMKAAWHDRSLAPDHAAMSDEAMQTVAANRVAHGLYTWEPYMHNPKLRYRLHRIDIPTPLIWGENDGIVTPDYGAALRDLIPGASMSVIPEAGHHPHIEQPDQFAARFLEFVNG